MQRATENPRPLSGTNMGTFCQIKVVSDSLQLDVSKSPSKNRKIESQKITVFSLYLRHLSADPQLLRGKKMLPGMPDHSAFYAQGHNLMPGAQKWPPKSITPQKKQPLFLAPVNFGRRFGAFMPRFGQRHYNRLCSARPGVHPDTRNISNWHNH